MRQPIAARALRPRMIWLAALALGQLAAAGPSRAADPAYLQPPANTDPDGRCDYFARLHRFAEESKSMCDEGRQVKVGPVMSRILGECETRQGARYGRLPPTGLMDELVRQVQSQGMGNACHEVGVQVWAVVQQ